MGPRPSEGKCLGSTLVREAAFACLRWKAGDPQLRLTGSRCHFKTQYQGQISLRFVCGAVVRDRKCSCGTHTLQYM